jgi:hypothetical protein
LEKLVLGAGVDLCQTGSKLACATHSSDN